MESKQAFLETIMRTDTGGSRKTREGQYYAQQLIDSQRRLAELHEHGVRGLSRYDIEIAHQGNADEALLTAKRLLGNQVKYFQKKIVAFNRNYEQLVLF